MEVRNLETELDRKGIQLKGEILISILYQEEGESGQLQWYETITPFNGTVECEIERDESVFFQMEEQVLSGELEVKPDADGEERMLVSELSLGLDIKIWQEKEIRMLEDLYALDRKLIPVCQDVETERLLVKNSSELRMTEQMKLDADKEILQICSCEGTVHIERTGREEKGLWAEGILQVELLYITSEDQMPVGAAKEVYSFEQLIEIPGTAGQQREELNCRLKQLQAVMTDQSHAEIKAVIELNLMAFEEQRVQTVVEVKEEPFDPKELQNRPGLLGYIAKDTDSLWAIAKKNGTIVKNIMEENGKKDDTLKKGERILIIKKVEY